MTMVSFIDQFHNLNMTLISLTLKIYLGRSSSLTAAEAIENKAIFLKIFIFQIGTFLVFELLKYLILF